GTATVVLPCRGGGAGYFHGHGESWPVLGDLVPGVPAVGLAGEHARGTEYVVQLSVADHQPGGDVVLHQDRHDGSVFAAHLPVQGAGVGAKPRSVQLNGATVHRVSPSLIRRGGARALPCRVWGRAVGGSTG